MADNTRQRPDITPSTESRTTAQSSQATPVRRRQSGESTSGPFGLMRQMQDDLDHFFSRFGFGRSMFPSRLSRSEHMGDWAPAIDAFQRANEFIIRADVPGMNRPDLSVEVGDEAVTIRGERHHEAQEDREGMFWSERSYGSFYRVVPLPPGAIPDSAKATFNNGVLEIVVQAPSQEARRGRKVEITGGRDEK
jgi:HSP20 family protein